MRSNFWRKRTPIEVIVFLIFYHWRNCGMESFLLQLIERIFAFYHLDCLCLGILLHDLGPTSRPLAVKNLDCVAGDAGWNRKGNKSTSKFLPVTPDYCKLNFSITQIKRLCDSFPRSLVKMSSAFEAVGNHFTSTLPICKQLFNIIAMCIWKSFSFPQCPWILSSPV